jgi:hypothetical protein
MIWKCCVLSQNYFHLVNKVNEFEWMSMLNQQKIRWITREMKKEKRSVYRIAKLQQASSRKVRELYQSYQETGTHQCFIYIIQYTFFLQTPWILGSILSILIQKIFECSIDYLIYHFRTIFFSSVSSPFLSVSTFSFSKYSAKHN